MNNEFILNLIAQLHKSNSKKQINADIKQLEKTINMLRITGVFAKGNTKKELNAYINSLQSQLGCVKLTAKLDSKNLKQEVNNALKSMSFKDIDLLNIDEGKTKLKARKVIADIKSNVEKNTISVNIESKKNKLNNDLTSFLNKNSKINESSVLLKEAEKVRELINVIDDRKSLRDATDAFQLYKSEVRATGFTSKSTAEKIKGMLGHISKIGSAFGIASFAVNNFVKSLKTLKENNTIITEISKTSEMTKTQLKELYDEAFKIASKYGQLSGNYLLSVQEMARSGYEETSKELGELSLLAQSAGDMTAENANNYLLATDAAYKYSGSVEKLNAALDGANYISNRNSASLTDIANATRVSASFAANAGVAIDELTAAEATMIATTKRSGSEMGRAFRSIILNLQGVSGEFDGEIIDEEQLKKVEARCHSLGVELEYMKDGIATLRNPIEVLKDLAEVYNSLPDNSADKQGLISDLGGKYHANALSSLLSRWDLYEKMLSEFSRGTGSALEEAEKTANSWEGRLNSLQNSWDSFINTLTNKEVVMGGISFFDRLIQGAEKLTDTIGEIPLVLTTLNTALTAMRKDYGITQIWNKDTNKLDIQGSMLGIDFTSIKEQKKHFSEASEAITIWNNKMKMGKNDIESFNYSVVKNNAQLKDYLSTTSKDAPASLSGYKAHLNAAGASTDALRLKTILLNSVISMGLGIAIQAVVQGIVTLIHSEENMRQQAKELGSELPSSADSIEDYKTKIDELKLVINDSSSSIDEVTQARVDLMKIQDELIDKFGTEKDAIESITSAINDQTDALDELSRNSYFRAKNEFNKTGVVKQVIDWLDVVLTDDANNSIVPKMDKMVHTMKYGVTDYHLETSGNEKLDKLISKAYNAQIYEENGKEYFLLSGSIEELQEKLFGIQDIVSNFEVGDDFEKSFTNISNEVDDLIEKNKELYDQSVLWEKILNEDPDNPYSKQFDLIKNAKDAYDEALKSNDDKAIENAANEYSKILSGAVNLAIQNKDGDVADYFKSMYPELQQIFGEWQFSLDFEPNTNGLKDQVESALDLIDGTLDGTSSFSVEDIENFNLATASSDQLTAYGKLINAADTYGLSLKQLITLLQEMGLVQTESYQQLVDTFGQENIDKIPQEDLKFAYEIKNIGDLSFDELLFKIRDVKSAAKEPLSFSDSISQVQALSKGLDQLDKIYADVYDKKDFDWTSMLNNKDFEETFGTDGLKEEYDNFIQTISNAPDDIDACQDSFNRLATAYINSTDAMKGLSKETENATVELLKQMGISNAEEVVTARLAAQEAFLAERKRNAAIVSSDLESATWDEIAAVAAEGEASEETRVYLANLALEKLDFTNNPIDTDKDVNAICNIALAAGKSQEYVTALRTALVNLMNINMSIASSTNPIEKLGFMGLSATMQGDIDKYVAEIQGEINSKIDLDTIRAQFTGGSETESTKEKLAKEAEKEFKETYNWIETIINRIERLISHLKQKAESIYKTWTSRNNNLREELSAVRNEIELQQRAYERYMQQADSVGLSSDWAEKVRNGQIDIETITDEDLSKKIKEYQEWYEKALDCQDAVEELNETVSDLYKTDFDNIAEQYDNFLSDIEHRKNMLDASISHTEEKGWLVSAEYYKKLIETERENILQMERKQNDLIRSLNNAVNSGAIEEYSQAWYDMRKQIDDVTLSISEANTEMVKYGNSIREIQWEVFDLIQERMSNISSEAEFLINLLENDKLYNEDNGQLTDEGMSIMGLHGVNYNTYMAQADEYAKEMLNINKQLADDPNNQTLAERRQELVDLQQEMILAAEEEKQAIRDMVEEGINYELDALKKLIDSYNEALDSQKDLYDYQKRISEQTKEISSLQKQLAAYEGDLSEETRLKVQQIKVSLEEAQENLEETEYEKYIADQKQILDDLFDEYELALNQRLDNIDALLADMIDKINSNASDISKTIQEKSKDVGYTLSDSMENIWSTNTGSITSVLTTYGDNIQNGILSAATTVNDTLKGINSNIQSMISQLDAIAGTSTPSVTTNSSISGSSVSGSVVGTISKQDSGKSNIVGLAKSASNENSGNSIWGRWFVDKTYSGDKSKLNINGSIVDRLKSKDIDPDQREKYFYAMGRTDKYSGTGEQNAWMLEQMKINGFSKGGYIADLQKTAYKNGDDMITINTLKRGEAVLTTEQTAKFNELVKNLDIANIALDLPYKLSSIPQNLPSDNLVEKTVNNNIDVDITLPNVTNYEEFMTKMIHDRKAKRALQEITLGELAGHGSLRKYNVRFKN